MQIKVDEDLPRQMVTLLREKGYQADSVFEQGMAVDLIMPGIPPRESP